MSTRRNAVVFGAYSEVINDDLKEQLKDLGCDPIAILAEMALDEMAKPELRLAAARELAQYVRPKLKAVDIKVEQKINRGVAIIRYSEVDPEAAAIAREAAKLQNTGTDGKVPVTPEEVAKATFDMQRETEMISGVMVEHLRKEAEKPRERFVNVGEVITEILDEEEPEGVVPPYVDSHGRMDRNGKPQGRTFDNAEVQEDDGRWSATRPYRLGS
jgi:hypothetical protein